MQVELFQDYFFIVYLIVYFIVCFIVHFRAPTAFSSRPRGRRQGPARLPPPRRSPNGSFDPRFQAARPSDTLCVMKDTELEKLQNCLQFVWS